MSDQPTSGDNNPELLGPFTGTIISFSERGFGRIALDNNQRFEFRGAERDPFVHINDLIAAGIPDVLRGNPEGLRVNTFVTMGERGPDAVNITFIDDVTAMAAIRQKAFEERRARAPVNPPKITETGLLGTVKFYRDDKGYGFITRDDGKGDEFIHATNTRGVVFQEGQRLKFDVAANPDKPGKFVAVNMELTDIPLDPNAATATSVAHAAVSAGTEVTTAIIPTVDQTVDPAILAKTSRFTLSCVGFTNDKQPIFIDETIPGRYEPFDAGNHIVVDAGILSTYANINIAAIKVGTKLSNIAGSREKRGDLPVILPSSYIAALELQETGQQRHQEPELLRRAPVATKPVVAATGSYSSETGETKGQAKVVVEKKRPRAVRKSGAKPAGNDGQK